MDGNRSHSISEVIQFIRNLKAENPSLSKDQIASATATKFNLKLSRRVFHCADFAIRFSIAKGSSFSNTVLSLSALAAYDKAPFIVCIVKPKDVEFLLANPTFLKKISHSSHHLRVDNVKGSFLGHDILREFDGLKNIPENFDKLFAIHGEFTWDENLVRIVEATTAIVPTGSRFTRSADNVTNVLSAGNLAKRISGTNDYAAIQKTLDKLVADHRGAIMKAAEVNNIKGNSALSFFFVAIDLDKHLISTRLVSVFDSTILKATRIQFHWAGRNSRGVTQLTGDLSSIFRADFEESINASEVDIYLKKLLGL